MEPGRFSGSRDEADSPRSSKKRASDAQEDSRSHQESRPSKQRRIPPEKGLPDSDTIVLDAPTATASGSETEGTPESSDSEMSDAAEPEGEVWKRHELKSLAQPPPPLLNRKMEA
ncbi:hypothetical protein MMC10_005461 [Thelotrema lepadinum]|nr:hypothetical protein [Thelotrema lepadinum]